jgi:hypothetical protein
MFVSYAQLIDKQSAIITYACFEIIQWNIKYRDAEEDKLRYRACLNFIE